MTKEILKQYRFCKKRIRELEDEIDRYKRENTVQDSVQGSQQEYPYIMRTTVVHGCPDIGNDSSELSRLYAERTKCKRIVRDVSVFVYSIENSILQRALILKYMEGDYAPEWNSVAMKIGGGNTADGIRKAVTRFIEKI